MKPLLLDTGPIVALLDRNDPGHPLVTQRFGSLSGRLVTSAAVVTEAMFFAQDMKDGPLRLVDFLRRARAEVIDVLDADSLHSVARLMDKYSDVPMDFADATLVRIADRIGCRDILTLDERGFRIFRAFKARPFRLVLQDGPGA